MRNRMLIGLLALLGFLMITGCTSTTDTTTTTAAATTSTTTSTTTTVGATTTTTATTSTSTSTTTTSTTTTTVSIYAQAAGDLDAVATGLQSSGGGAGNSAGSTGSALGDTESQVQGVSVYDVVAAAGTPEGDGWTETAYSYTWTASVEGEDVVITEEGTTWMRFVDASGESVAQENMVTWEVVSMEVEPYFTAEVTFLATDMQMYQEFSAPSYSGTFDMSASLPTIPGLPMTMTMFGTAELDFSGAGASGITAYEPSIPEVFVMTMNMVQTIESEDGTGSSGGTMDWEYIAPGDYAYYYGEADMTMVISGEVGTPQGMTGPVNQDLTDDGTQNGTEVGTITMDPSAGIIRIDLDDGTTIYAGSF